MLEKIADTTDQARITAKTQIDDLVMKEPAVNDSDYMKGSSLFQELGPVLWASDGHYTDFGDNSLLTEYRPDLLRLPTTNDVPLDEQ
eukprot:10791442-Heterocapsa_arctica.AAC.1